MRLETRHDVMVVNNVPASGRRDFASILLCNIDVMAVPVALSTRLQF